MKALVSPTDSKVARLLGQDAIVSNIPEQRGADILLFTRQGSVGIQRKEVPNDFISSIEDGRFAMTTSLLPKFCTFSLLLCEGKFKYWPDGRVVLYGKTLSRYTKPQVQNVLFSIKYVKGVDYDFTEDIEHTVRYIRQLYDFMNKEKHLGFFTRPAAKGRWVIPTAREVESWILQGFPGVGPATADKIISSCGGRIPLKWTCTYEELLSVPGLSKKRAGLLWKALGNVVEEEVSKSVFDSLRMNLGK